jgi:hypothetical protein
LFFSTTRCSSCIAGQERGNEFYEVTEMQEQVWKADLLTLKPVPFLPGYHECLLVVRFDFQEVRDGRNTTTKSGVT